MKQYAVLGRQLPYTLSPLIYNTAFGQLGIPARYTVLELEPDEFASRMAGVKKERSLAGFNITIPYKLKIMAFLDETDPVADQIGAVNTVTDHNGRWKGCNTDVAGFLQPLSVTGKTIRKAVILGAGGAARAVLYALQATGHPEVSLAVRDLKKGGLLRNDFRDLKISVHDFTAAGKLLHDADLLVNTTPLGTWPDVTATPLADLSLLKAGSIVYDLVYNPDNTRLQQDAKDLQRGITCIGGLEMLLGQAAAAFRLWTGRELPVEAVKKAVSRRQ
jgi:shikimate dehydrogenase